ncbi:MAG: (d)CMP kinase [Acidimicrobiales bacterium]
MTIIAIDGPAGSGKSTVACLLAERLGLSRLDTGAMYRSVAWTVLARGVDLHDGESVSRLARGLDISMSEEVRVDGQDVTEAIRTPEVDRAVSVVAAVAEVRADMVARQRRWALEHGGGVIEGRDIATVVFPQADLKVYLTATELERARRRLAQQGRALLNGPDDQVAQDLARRDQLDSERAHSPLAVAIDSLVIDTTSMSTSQVVDEVIRHL